jgi:hypothetical protein
VVPGVDVAGEEQEAILLATLELADQMGDRHPARTHARGQRQAQRPARE